ncbi:MAG: aminotransferase class I/II-fold pyridoxal phosphate-dependent enzyme [Verrucomicrobiales bacterium]|nr:aminotransferase class I/II-fold pyridoxal phosphate-dependent enzyme [Verrucomicrobiales bacterium]
MKPELPEAGRSEYMHWAKTRQAARFNLANSGLSAVTRSELGVTAEDFELSGPSFYGWSPLLEALAQHLRVDQARICHAEGTSMANHLAMAVCLHPGDEVLIESPTYELLVDTAHYLRAKVRRFPRPRALAFQPDLAALREALTSRTRLIVLTNLHNPSSARIPDATLREIADMARSVGAHVLIDEVYLDAVFDPAATTAHIMDDVILTTSSLTKVYGLSGLRCGWCLAAPDLVEKMWRLNDLFGVIPSHAAERLSLLALQRLPALRDRARQRLETHRDLWNAFLAQRHDMDDNPMLYGTVAFPRLRKGSVNRLCDLLRSRFETTVAPGSFFGLPDSFRVGLGLPTPEFTEGLHRLGQALDLLHGGDSAAGGARAG